MISTTSSDYNEDLLFALRQAVANGFNIMLIGQHGVGKTALIRAACTGHTLHYLSGPLVDPDVDIGGLPMPDEKTGTVRFFTPPALTDAEVIFIDELNRASPRTLNMLFELIQFKSIHGKPLPKLRCVMAAINPPTGEYDVERLDPALMDRFMAFYQVEAQYSAEYLAQFVAPGIAQAFVNWVQQDVGETVYISPRRLEYAARLCAAGMDYGDCFQHLGEQLPIAELYDRIKKVKRGDVA